MVKLFIKDNLQGRIHEYGTDQHDSLVLQEDGSLHYYNLQNGCGTRFPEKGYSFVLEDGSDPRNDTEGESYIDIGGAN